MLASLTLVSFLLLLDDTAVALALPAMRRQLGFGLAGLEWVINGYTLPLAALMLLGGKLADRLGRRRVFLIGLAIFTPESRSAQPAKRLDAAGVASSGIALAALLPAMTEGNDYGWSSARVLALAAAAAVGLAAFVFKRRAWF